MSAEEIAETLAERLGAMTIKELAEWIAALVEEARRRGYQDGLWEA